MMFRSLIFLSFFLFRADGVEAAVELAPLFRDGAVLQQGQPVPVWGRANPGGAVTVEFKGQKQTATADGEGKWLVRLDPMEASAEPAELMVKGESEVRVKDVLVGEVWLCSGQSNMEWQVSKSLNAPVEIANGRHPLIRHFDVKNVVADLPMDGVEGSWVTCSPATVGDFSAVAYYFARELQEQTQVPVGLVNATWGGTPIEAWMSLETLQGDPAFAKVLPRWEKELRKYPARKEVFDQRLEEWKKAAAAARVQGQPFTEKPPRAPQGPGSPWAPATLYNAMLHPLVPYALRGVIWYQGEANAERFDEYGALFAALIKTWREEFLQPELPFYFVQLANLDWKLKPDGNEFAFQREAQATALKIEHTGMALAIDIGEADTIHPLNKQEVGRRLSLWALSHLYQKNLPFSGPVFLSARQDGSAMRITFDHNDGLILRDSEKGGFEVAGADRRFYPAQARVEGSDVLVAAPEVSAPEAVRYAWKNNPPSTLYNASGLPTAPFRSDNWKPVVE